MKITNETTLRELNEVGLVEYETFIYLKNYGCDDVRDVVRLSKNSIFMVSQKREVRAFAVFLNGIVDFLWRCENDIIKKELDSLLPDTLLYTIRKIYQSEEKRFKAECVFSLILYDVSDSFFSFFLYRIITSPKSLFDFEVFKARIQKGTVVIKDVGFEYVRYKYAMISVIEKIMNALGNFPDCLYYKNLLKCTCKELEISEKQIQEADAYANLLNKYPVKIEEINAEDTISLLYVNDDIQNKYEEFQKSLSVRTQNIIKYNIPSYSDLIPWVLGKKTEFNFRNCGKKSIMELKGFLKEFRNFYNSNVSNLKVENKVGSDYLKSLSYLLEIGSKNTALNIDAYNCIMEIYTTWESFAMDMSNIVVIYDKIVNRMPKQALDCLEWLIVLFSSIVHNLFNRFDFKSYVSVFSRANENLKSKIEENRTELEYQKYITDEKEILIAKEYKKLLSITSVQCRNAIENNIKDYREFLTYEGRERDFYNFHQVGRKCVEEMSYLLRSFKTEYARILKNGNDSAKVEILYSKFPYLNENDIEFINRYELKYQHLPMFYILCRYYENTSNRNAQIFASYYGLTDNPIYSLEGLSKKYKISRERIRQLLIKISYSTDDNYRKLMEKSLWQCYGIESVNFQTPQKTLYYNLCKEEQVDFSFFTYCKILSLFKNITIINISESGKVLSSLEVDKYRVEDIKFKTYACDSRYSYFNYAYAMYEVKRLLRVQTSVDVKIPIYDYFITNSDYWINNDCLKETGSRSLLQFFEVLVKDTLGVNVENHYLILKANTLDYSEIMYKILKEHGESMSLYDIFRKFKESYPESKFNEAKQIKPHLYKDSRIKNLGRTSYYTLIEWKEYTGSLSELAIKLVKNNKAPINIIELAKKMLVYRPSSTERSTRSIIYQCVNNGKLLLFYGDLVGVPTKKYKEGYIVLPRNFDEWMSAFRGFILKNGYFPSGSHLGFERALANWYNDARNYINLSSEEILKFHQMMNDFEKIPHTAKEKHFLENCELYKGYVRQFGRMLSIKDEKSLYCWFVGNLKKYMSYEDNRRFYFKELILFLQDEIDI